MSPNYSKPDTSAGDTSARRSIRATPDATELSVTHTGRQFLIRNDLLSRSRVIQSPHFLRSTAADLRLLFDNYDRHFFDGSLAAALRAQSPVPLALDWSGRLRSSGGVTTRLRNRRGVLSFRITVSQPLLFDNFRHGETATVVGLPCADRLDGLMRIFEHELLHLHEFLTFGQSNCARPRFQKLAAAHFGHAEHRHRLTTPQERILQKTTLRPGSIVTFIRDGQELRGRINRIHTRATVLVPSSKGQRYTDGGQYEKFYVPLAMLKDASSVPSPG